MSVYQVEYADSFGVHAEAVEAWDEQEAQHEFRLRHCGEQYHLVDVVRAGALYAGEEA